LHSFYSELSHIVACMHQLSKTCSRHIFSHVLTSLTKLFPEYEQQTLYDALVVTLAVLLHLVNCCFIIICCHLCIKVCGCARALSGWIVKTSTSFRHESPIWLLGIMYKLNKSSGALHLHYHCCDVISLSVQCRRNLAKSNVDMNKSVLRQVNSSTAI